MFSAAQAQLFGVVQLEGPVDVGVDVLKFVGAGGEVFQLGAGEPRGLVHQVGRGLVDGHRVVGGHDADVPDDGGVVEAVAVAGRGHLGDEVDEQGPVLFVEHDPVGVFHHFLQEHRDGLVPLDLDVAVGAHRNAFGATHAYFGVDDRLFRLRVDVDGLHGAVGHALAAAGAFLFGDQG